MLNNYHQNRGVTLIMVAGVLAVLAAMSAGFYTIVTSQTKSSVGYSDTIHAEFMARSGIFDAISRLREGAFQKIEDPTDPWYTTDYLHGAMKRISFAQRDIKNLDSLGQPRKMSFSRSLQNSTGDINSDQYTLEISDASSKININACENLGVLLDNLCRVIGPPLIAGDQDRLQPRVWATLGAQNYGANTDDKATQGACYYMPTGDAKSLLIDKNKKPVVGADGSAMYGDGYAIARYRAVHGRFQRIEDVKNALSVKTNVARPELESMEREIKFNAIKDYITIDSFVDTSTVCVGKFEWVSNDIAIDRDKSWIEDAGVAVDPKNQRGSLRGSYVSIINGHGAGQLRRIETNGVDWIKIKPNWVKVNGTTLLTPGPISSYMIISREDALMEDISSRVDNTSSSVSVPKQDAAGLLTDDPDIDYERYPLCIHRAPININTASDKVLAAMFMGINVSHGHYMSIGTDVDVNRTFDTWYEKDRNGGKNFLPTVEGLKRVPVSSGKIVYDKSLNALKTKLPKDYNVDYINNYGALAGPDKMSEAHALALRIIVARQNPKYNPATGKYVPDSDPLSINASGTHNLTGPFKSWDDLYFRVVRPWDEDRYLNDTKRGHAAQMVMAHFNSNTDILKFNPGIEWIDRWGRNFTEMEPVLTYVGGKPVFIDKVNSPTGGNKAYKKYMTRNLRYKADEMIDKTDLNRSTTEFCFNSGGIFEIRSVGRVLKSDVVLAERKFESLVQIYDVWRESTQRQFVNGEISTAENHTSKKGAISDFARSGKPVRHGKAYNGSRLALDTLPEPLAPLAYRLNHNGRNYDVVDTIQTGGVDITFSGRNCYGVARDGTQTGSPDVNVNRVLPSAYDGQIVLATNTSRYDEAGEESDTFLASFNGDLDTDTSVGNGREQAKSPGDRTTRVLDTCSLLGVLNDTDQNHVDFDMKDGRGGDYKTFRLNEISTHLKPLDPTLYTESISCRMGDLRPEGVWLGFVGVSGNDGTIKYLIDVDGTKRKNWNPEDGAGSSAGGTVSMWFKPNWHADDDEDHEFFSATNPGDDWTARYDRIVKGAGTQSDNVGNNSLVMCFEDKNDGDTGAWLSGGRSVEQTGGTPKTVAFRTQPFRWSMVGGVIRYNRTCVAGGPDFQGYEQSGGASAPKNIEVLKNICRPFISMSVNPEGSKWSPGYYWSRMSPSTMNGCDLGTQVGKNQQAAWDWADGGKVKSGNARADLPVFGANNLNKQVNMWLYRETPIEGTMAVVDELKLSKKMWDMDLISQTMCTSRYYLPREPSNPANCPTFTSQTLLQSMKGATTLSSTLKVQPMRINWTCFTPRFMHEHIYPNIATAGGSYTPGPFSYAKYNKGILDPNSDDVASDRYGVIRPTISDYEGRQQGKPAHGSAGIEVELLNGAATITGLTETSPTTRVSTQTFTNPEVFNAFPSTTPFVKAQDLRYRVRFRYPVDPFFGGGSVDSKIHFLIDTPVFDDISITYSIVPRIIDFKEVTQ